MENNDDSSVCKVDYVGIWRGALWYATRRLFYMWLFGTALQYFFQLPFVQPAWFPTTWLYEEPSLRRECHRLLLGIPFDVLAVIICMAYRMYENHHLRKLRKAMVPQTLYEFKTAGVKTPLDFCYLVLTMGFVVRNNIMDGTQRTVVPFYNSDLYVRQIGCFKALFGRNPMRAETADWLTITICEMFFFTKNINYTLTFSDFVKMVSPEVINYSAGGAPVEWYDILNESFPVMMEELSDQ